jgi:hypothetical protein
LITANYGGGESTYIPLVGETQTLPSTANAQLDSNLHDIAEGTDDVVSVDTSSGQTVTATTTGTGSVTLGQYKIGPPGELAPLASTGYLDIKVASGAALSALEVTVCNSAVTIDQVQWWDPNENEGEGGYLPLLSTSTTVNGQPCAVFDVTSSSSPSIADLTGTVFAVGLPSAADTTEPSSSLPETPSIIALPLATAAIISGCFFKRRRRENSAR